MIYHLIFLLFLTKSFQKYRLSVVFFLLFSSHKVKITLTKRNLVISKTTIHTKQANSKDSNQVHPTVNRFKMSWIEKTSDDPVQVSNIQLFGESCESTCVDESSEFGKKAFMTPQKSLDHENSKFL